MFAPHRTLVIPREHGAWFMLLLSLVIGAGAAGSFGLPSVLLSLSAAALFSSLYSLGEGTKKASKGRETGREASSALIYFLLALVLISPLFFAYRLWPLLSLGLLVVPFFGFYLYLMFRRKHRTAWGEMVNIAGISFPAAASYYVAAGALTSTSLLLWLLTFLYSGGSVFYVRLKVKQKVPYSAGFSQRLIAGKDLLIYLLFLFATLLVLAAAGLIPAIAVAAYLPLALKCLSGIFYSRGTASLKKIGLMEAGYTAIFAVLLLITFHP